MSIRRTRKDHLHERAGLALVSDRGEADRQDDGMLTSEALQHLVFTRSGKAIDFSCLFDGVEASPNASLRTAFAGRPELAAELMPALRDLAASRADGTVRQTLTALRFFWRTFDEMEDRVPGAPRLQSVRELSSVHRQAVVDRGHSPQNFSLALTPINLTRLAMGEKRLAWSGPSGAPNSVKELVILADVKRVKNSLKRLWFGWRDRHEAALQLLATPCEMTSKLPAAQLAEFQGLRAFREAQAKYGCALPTLVQFEEELRRATGTTNVASDYRAICRCLFPSGTAIKAAVHLCMATTGWNPAVLIGLDVRSEIFLPHPVDAQRYIMAGIKQRGGGNEQRSDGLKKSQSGPYAIINLLIATCEPLRQQLRSRIAAIDDALREAKSRQLDEHAVLALRQERIDVVTAARSPWLYLANSRSGKNSGNDGILTLTDANYMTGARNRQFIQVIIDELNKERSGQPIAQMTSTDFRDAYALHWYEFSGGDILTVMRALQHRSLDTSVTYTNNVVVRVRNRARARRVMRVWWAEVEEVGHADATIVAFTVLHGRPSAGQRQRLGDFRGLMLTRQGVRCANPHHPRRMSRRISRPMGSSCAMCIDALCVSSTQSSPGKASTASRAVLRTSGISSRR